MRTLLRLDLSLPFVALVLSLIGIALMQSFLPEAKLYLVKRQLLWLALSTAAMFVFTFFDYRKLIDLAPYFYVIYIAVLVGLLFSGSSSWIRLGAFSFQPSEAGKVVVALMVAHTFGESRNFPLNFLELLKLLALVGLPALLIALQPDLGTAFIYSSFVLAVMLVKGVRKLHLEVLVLLLLVAGLLSWNFLLRDYQKRRILSFLFPSFQDRAVSYQVYQSRIAIGSGGLFGKGYGQASQAERKFLPAAHTDFIFSVLAEQFGFAGVAFLLVLYLYLYLRMLTIASLSYDPAAVLLVCLLAGWMAFQTFMNVAIALGLFPVAGFPLPFLSYGGSCLLTSFVSVGIVNSTLVWR